MQDAKIDRYWVKEAVRVIEADFNRSADTYLLRVPLPSVPHISLYLKDESTHPSGSLKHRLARSLFLYGLCNGWVGPSTTVVEASSGSTAVSEAYFAQMLGLRFIAVMPRSTAGRRRRPRAKGLKPPVRGKIRHPRSDARTWLGAAAESSRCRRSRSALT